MPSFDAGTVERLDYTFQPYHPESGTVPEPSDQQIGDFLSGLKDVAKSAGGLAAAAGFDMNDPAAVLDALNSLNGQDFVDMMATMAALFAALCSGKPSAETLLAVPIRARNLFYKWLQEEVLSPEAVPAAGTQPAQLRSIAAGG